MDTSSSGNSSDVASKWRLIKLDNTEYAISCRIANDEWKILLSNLIELWCEALTEDSAIRRCEKLNPLLNVNVVNAKKILQEIFDDIPRHAVCASTSSIRLEATISGGAFKFDLNLSKASPQEFWQEITEPLCRSAMEMQRRQSILLNLIKRKDEEISEYKARGGELIRKSIETAPFHEDLFKEKSGCTDSSGLIIDTFRTMMDLHNQIKKPESSRKMKSEPLGSDDRQEMTDAEVAEVKIEIDRSSAKESGRSSRKTGSIDPEESSVTSSGSLRNEVVADNHCKTEIPAAKRSPAKRPRREDRANDLLFS
ncbi:non-homologous end-joining factor 1 isoform X2 [Cephus cinctus]|uniref:Non-homologous end-joining factor 1 n=1 Tax=Cephus cinctus TaxID=211228 RepID=A0AAJ7BKJ2_CEPCN|nr:non-homologous end-joining factor 1 isoform X2 [Cephus cinctus]XP_015588365.1 non-homologous end-joining factor 1 isoform X2 [Cephus cinctus]XP_015588366.1 non-homologous end-joining factor 1 isoform X2 [Cephus cinctus]